MKRKKQPPAGPKEWDWLPPVPGIRDEWHRVALVMNGKVMAVEVWHGDPPQEKPVKKKSKAPAWVPKERNPFELSPVVEKFLLWRYGQPAVRPLAGSLTMRQKDRLLRGALVQKRTNWTASPGLYWGTLRQFGATDEVLMRAIWNEFGVSGPRVPNHDKRRVMVTFYRKGKKNAVFIIGESDDPDRYVLEGAELLCAVRRTMKIPRTF